MPNGKRRWYLLTESARYRKWRKLARYCRGGENGCKSPPLLIFNLGISLESLEGLKCCSLPWEEINAAAV